MTGRAAILSFILAEIRSSIRNARRRDLAWAVLGGGFLIAYALWIVLRNIGLGSEAILAADWIWFGALPAGMLLTGAMTGWGLARLAQRRAHAPFLKALPIADRERRAMARYAALRLAAPLIVIDGVLISAMVAASGQSWPIAWGGGATAIAVAALILATAVRLRLEPQISSTRRPNTFGRGGFSIAALDRFAPRWLGSWALGLTGGRIRMTWQRVAAALFFAAVGTLAAMMSIVQSNAGPAIVVGVAGGLAIFMLTLRCAPLLSPVLRASALGFTRAVRGLVRLPLLLSAMFFAGLAAPAMAAEPAMAAIPLSGAIGLLALNAIYAVFAAFFAHSRRLAALAFFAAIGLAAYESLEYGRTVVIGLLALVVFLWVRARRAYRLG